MIPYRPHPSNDGAHRPTPDLSRARQPTEGELLCYQTGVKRYLNLAQLGGFRTWPLEGLFSGVTLSHRDFNCITWAVGHTDRWIEPGTIGKMNALFKRYHLEECSPALAEVEVYRILDAPPTLTTSGGRQYQNPRSFVTHAHRRDAPRLDSPFNLGCSSKLGLGPLIAHNRRALEDTRPYGSRNPGIMHGSIFQWWRRTPEHPSFPGKEANLVPATGHYPDDPIFAFGYGKYPPGHPGNTIDLPTPSNQAPEIEKREKKSRGWFSRSKGATAKGKSSQKAPQGPDNSSPGPATVPQPPSGPRSKYAQVPQMRAHDPIPPPSRDAWDSAVQTYKKALKSSPKLTKAFEAKFHAWKNTWYSSSHPASSSAKVRCYVAEFDELLAMGPSILPLVVYKLLGIDNFTAVFLYNALERDAKYLIDPSDVLNFLVLQRQSNLIVDLNQGRRW